jgi:antitoxin FitA
MKMIQIRNVPDDVHRALKARAAREGTTMSDLLLAELPRLASRPSMAQLLERIGARSAVEGPPAADLIRSERDRR